MIAFHCRDREGTNDARTDIAASGVCAFMEFAISKGAGRQALVQRSGIKSAVLRDVRSRCDEAAQPAGQRPESRIDFYYTRFLL
jgi:hypothetical protein